MQRREKSTIRYGFAASLALHSAIIAALIWRISPPPPTVSPLVVIEVQGIVEDRQIEQKPLQEVEGREDADPPKSASAEAPQATSSEAYQDALAGEQPLPAPPPPKPTPVPSQKPETRPAVQPSARGTSARNIASDDPPQNAQTIKTEKELIELYVRLLAKKIQTNLVYPEEARQARLEGKATVSFAILSNGDIRPDSLAISASSGQALLDEGALRTVRSCLPFDPPPKEMNVSVGVTFGPEH